jgi:predicted DNA binding protein
MPSHEKITLPLPKEQITIKARQHREKELLLEQLKKTPIIQIACEKVGVSRSTYYRWRQADKEFCEAADDAQQEGVLLVNDMAESQLLSAMRDGNLGAVMYWLKHHHPSYTTKVEMKALVEHRNTPLTPEQKEMVKKALKLGGISDE